ncbi:hypothetical protein Poli38472_001814 [Pythium oligandrum]|uniref:Ankyrin repeat protein n=1 Tax=Pythium oligandrum TaxID=41045 RepID=A0A8K1FTJ8_PYTOL|nr:hypothetical protein Poli38472_001814 [Pythium oligandrum]|eukprot:TMW69658.1 hypothetical protein Poli38472_001814 [Pythium oligandrum]
MMLLSEAVEQGRVDEVAQWLEREESIVHETNESGQTLLHTACMSGHDNLDVPKLLVSHNADVNAMDMDGVTAFHAASASGRVDLVKFLLEQGADVNAVANEPNGWSTLHFAMVNDSIDVRKFMVGFEGVDINAVDEDGWSVLHAAYKRGDLEIVMILIELGAVKNAVTESGKSVLHAACHGGSVDAVEFVMTMGFDVNAGDHDGWASLQYAMISGTPGVPELLVAVHGADVNAADEDGWSVLHSSCKMGCLEVVEMLFEHDVDASAVTTNGVTVLHSACEGGELDVVKFLVARGLDVIAVNNREGQSVGVFVDRPRHGRQCNGSELENQLAHARAIHDLLGNLGLESGGVLNASKQRPVSPAGMYGLLRALLKIHDPDFQPDKICDLAKLECGMVLQEGGYRWAHRHELLQEPELYRLRVDYASDSMHSLNDTNNNHVPRTAVQPMFYLSDFQASRLASDDARLAHCTWELVDCARSVRLCSGETIQNPHEVLFSRGGRKHSY